MPAYSLKLDHRQSWGLADQPCAHRIEMKVKSKRCEARARLKARANSLKDGSVNSVRRGSRRTVMKKYRGKGRRNFDTALHYNRL